MNNEYLKWVLKQKRKENISVQIVQTPAGPSARIEVNGRSVSLHSLRNPELEAKKIVDSKVQTPDKPVILLGLGIGWTAKELLKRGIQKVIAVECSREIVKSALPFIGDIINHPNFYLILTGNPETVYSRIQRLGITEAVVIQNRAEVSTFKKFYTQTLSAVYSAMNSVNVNVNTGLRFGEVWQKNLISNSKVIAKAGGVDGLKDSFKGIPAVVVAAGPSLENNLPVLKKIAEKKKALIIAVDTALKILTKHSIVPHFVVSTDPQTLNSKHLTFNTKGDLPVLVADSSVSGEAFHRFKGKSILMDSVFRAWEVYEREGVKFGRVKSGGSVSTTAVAFAVFVGANPVVIVGQDLSNTDLKHHARGSFLDEKILKMSDRFYTAEKWHFLLVYSIPSIPVPAWGGNGTVKTDRRMIIYRDWLAKFSSAEKRQNPELKFVNSTEGGVHINGFEDKPLESVLEEFENGCLNFNPDLIHLCDFTLPVKTALSKLKTELEKFLSAVSKATTNPKSPEINTLEKMNRAKKVVELGSQEAIRETVSGKADQIALFKSLKWSAERSLRYVKSALKKL